VVVEDTLVAHHTKVAQEAAVAAVEAVRLTSILVLV